MTDELVRMEHISKMFGRVQALDDVSLTINEREIVGLVGDNGAGKSTLIKILSGAHKATSGDIYFKNKPVKLNDTWDAIELGIETIYQDSALVPQLSIIRNLFLGREPIIGPRFLNRMDKRRMERETSKLFKKVGLTKELDPNTPITALSGGERQSIAIARAMFFEADLIILDEPTNNLGVEETQGVLRFIRNARDAGVSCVFITHNIYHVFQVVDRIVIIRRGKKVCEVNPKKTTIEEVEKVITGISDTLPAAALV
ncbi:ATP-binding cassette domain-containing protein [Aggregatilinea lenta]|uniref:ATP-binding cassette domain-containing protein n=1 Tax=Aggregatilinea lenta TaxID=913108 RepID=UPI000E5A3235|nr:ATP-binding cassette domain-containing protein [Aggregatilinea lenta]